MLSLTPLHAYTQHPHSHLPPIPSQHTLLHLHPQNAPVRAAAVSVLAKFGAQCDGLLPNILMLLQRCMMDTEDEVRDRATYYHAILATRDSTLIHRYILNPPQVTHTHTHTHTTRSMKEVLCDVSLREVDS